jgi:cytochrome P450
VCASGLDQLAQLSWIEACANEAMRLKPVAPQMFAEAQRETVVEGVRVEPGEIVICLMRMGGLRDGLFPQALAFRPERWLAGEGAAAQSLASSRRAVMPFGAGPRMCPGRYLALAEIKMAASMLLANFEIVSVQTEDGREPAERLAITMHPVGLRMKLAA